MTARRPVLGHEALGFSSRPWREQGFTGDSFGVLPNTINAWETNLLAAGIAGWEAVPVRGLFFAGEHTDSFDSWQGFMEGAALSGRRAAA